jgi:hypothetical protein
MIKFIGWLLIMGALSGIWITQVGTLGEVQKLQEQISQMEYERTVERMNRPAKE